MNHYYSLEAEQAVIGSLLLDNTAWPDIQDRLSFKDFYRREHQVLFDLISKKLAQGEGIDALTLSNEIKEISELKETNSEVYVFELLNQTFSTANIISYVEIVKEHAQRRQFKEILNYLDTHSSESDVKTLVKQAHQEFAKLELASLPTDHSVFSQLFSDIPHQSINWLWPGRIARGKVTIMAGNPGLGKSQITASLAAIVTTGGIWPVDNIPCQIGSVIFLSAEDDPGDTIGPRLNAAGADLSKARYLKCVHTKNKQGKLLQKSFSLKTDITNLDKFLDEVQDVALLIIDPITAYLGETDSYKNAEVRALLSPLSELAAKHNLAVLAISHLNKAAGQDPLMRVSGSLAFVAAARAAFLIAQDPNDDNRRLLLPMKNNIGNDKTGLAFSIESYSLESGIYTSRIVWENEAVEVKAHEVMSSSPDPEETSALKEAVEFLSDLLKDRPLSVKKIKTLAHQSGHSWITIRRAKEQLGIRPKKEFLSGEWIWRLPTDGNQLAQVDVQVAHTKKDEHLEHLEQHGQYLNDSKENSLRLVQSLHNLNNFSTKVNHVAQGAQHAHVVQVGKDEQHDEQDELRPLLTDPEEDAVYFDVTDVEVADE
jgi:putative DNA primase/helicase